MKQHLSHVDININCIAKFVFSQQPWLLEPSQFIFDEHNTGIKSEIPPEVFKSKVNEILVVFDGYQKIYIDVSKTGKAVSAAAIPGPRLSIKRLPDNSSIFSAMARAIY